MRDTVGLNEIYQALKKRWWLIMLITVILTASTAIATYFFITPIYEAKTEIIVTQSKGEQLYNYNEVQTNLQLVSTYTGIIKSPVVLEKVKENLKLENQLNTLRDQVSVGNEKNSQIISIIVRNPKPGEAVEIANEVANVFKNEIVNIMNIDNVSVLATAEVKDTISPVKPVPMLNILIALIIGLMIGSSIAFLIEFFDNTIKTETDIENLLNQSVLGVVSTHIQSENKTYRSQTSKSNNTVRSESIGTK